jgi:hypothetical protein
LLAVGRAKTPNITAVWSSSANSQIIVIKNHTKDGMSTGHPSYLLIYFTYLNGCVPNQ